MQRTFRGLILSAAAVCLVMPAIAAPGAQAAEKPQEWELVNPAGIIEKASVDPAKRIASLDGKTIALRWNSKHNGDVVLNRLAELLAKKYPSATIVKTYETDKSLNAISGTAAESERIAKAVASVKPDLVIASQCDRGSCTSWLVVDQCNLEKMGVPTVTIVTDQFVTLARGTQKSQGLTDMCFVTVPHPIGMLPKEQVDAKVDAAFGDIVKAATQWQPVKEKEAAQESPYPAKTFKFTGTYADVNKLFAKRKWSLSLPIIPPTVDRVREMLKGTKRAPSEVLWVVPPRQGMLTVELVAVLGVMAGAQPEHMPLLLATIDAMKAPEAAWRGTSTTTAPTSPLIVISGPIVEKLKLNAGTGTAGGENPVTNALGYFVNLVGDVVGGSVPPNFDKSTQGSSFDLVANVICENAKETPWDKTFAEEQGFTRDDSVVTISTSYLANANIDHDSVASEDLLNTFSAGIAGSASGIASCLTVTVPDEKSPYNKPLSAWSNSVSYAVLVISPEHAATMYRDMKSKDAIRDYLVKNTVLPYKFYTKATCVPPEAFGPYDANTLIPRFTQRESIKMIVSGGPGKQSQFWGPFPPVLKPVSTKIAE